MSTVLDMSNAKIVGMTAEARAAECLAIIQQTCKQYSCEIVPIITLLGGRGAQAGIQVMPMPLDKQNLDLGGK
jgi:hypothetical protein